MHWQLLGSPATCAARRWACALRSLISASAAASLAAPPTIAPEDHIPSQSLCRSVCPQCLTLMRAQLTSPSLGALRASQACAVGIDPDP